MRKPYKLCFLGVGQLSRLAEKVSRNLDLPDAVVEVVDCTLSALTEAVDLKIEQGFEVFISGSAYAAELSRYSRTPMAEVQVRDIDYLIAVKRALKVGKRPLLITYRYSRPVNLVMLRELAGAPIDHLVFEDEADLYQMIQSSSNDVIIAASVACGYAAELGKPNILVYAGEETVSQSILQAYALAVELRKERENDVLMQSIIAQSPIGIIATDDSDRIMLMNSAAQQYTGIKPSSPLQKTLAELAPNLSTKQLLLGNMFRSESYKMLNGVRVRTIQNKLRVGETTFGVLTTLQIDNNRSKRAGRSDSFNPDTHWEDLTASSAKMQYAISKGRACAESDLPLLLYGEYGVDKRAFAECVHTGGLRASGPLVTINLAAISEQDAGRHLLGCSDSQSLHVGLLETADNGTVILQNLEHAQPAAQACLVDVLNKHYFTRIGGTHIIPVNIRFITVLNGEKERPKKVRPDLFCFLNTLSIKLPSLSKRKEDIPELFAKKLSKQLQRKIGYERNPVVAELLQLYFWPGNLPELCAVASRFSHAVESYPRISSNTIQALLVEAIGEENLFQSILSLYPELHDWKHADPERFMEAIGALKRLLRYNNTQISKKIGIGRTTLWRFTSD